MIDPVDANFQDWLDNKTVKTRDELLMFWDQTPTKIEQKKIKKREEPPKHLYARVKRWDELEVQSGDFEIYKKPKYTRIVQNLARILNNVIMGVKFTLPGGSVQNGIKFIATSEYKIKPQIKKTLEQGTEAELQKIANDFKYMTQFIKAIIKYDVNGRINKLQEKANFKEEDTKMERKNEKLVENADGTWDVAADLDELAAGETTIEDIKKKPSLEEQEEPVEQEEPTAGPEEDNTEDESDLKTTALTTSEVLATWDMDKLTWFKATAIELNEKCLDDTSIIKTVGKAPSEILEQIIAIVRADILIEEDGDTLSGKAIEVINTIAGYELLSGQSDTTLKSLEQVESNEASPIKEKETPSMNTPNTAPVFKKKTPTHVLKDKDAAEIEAFVVAITEVRTKEVDIIVDKMEDIYKANDTTVSPMAKLMWHKVIPNYIQLLVFMGVDHIFKED